VEDEALGTHRPGLEREPRDARALPRMEGSGRTPPRQAGDGRGVVRYVLRFDELRSQGNLLYFVEFLEVVPGT